MGGGAAAAAVTGSEEGAGCGADAVDAGRMGVPSAIEDRDAGVGSAWAAGSAFAGFGWDRSGSGRMMRGSGSGSMDGGTGGGTSGDVLGMAGSSSFAAVSTGRDTGDGGGTGVACWTEGIGAPARCGLGADCGAVDAPG